MVFVNHRGARMKISEALNGAFGIPGLFVLPTSLLPGTFTKQLVFGNNRKSGALQRQTGQ